MKQQRIVSLKTNEGRPRSKSPSEDLVGPIRTLMPVCLVVMLGLLRLITPLKDSQATEGQVKLIAPGVWFREGEFREKDHCNNTWIEMKDYLILVDANWPSGAKACLEDVKKTTSKPIRYVFNTHHHEDHIYGNPIFTQMGATTVAYVGVVEEMKRYEPKRWQEAGKARKDVADLNLLGAEAPQKTFADKRMILDDGTRKVEFHFLGWAHTRGDGFVYLPNEGILCTGDVVVNGPYNYLGDGNADNWPKVIEQTQKFDVKTVVPGHGIPGGKELLEGQKQFLLELQKAVRAAVKSGKTLDELVTRDGDRRINTSIRLPESVKNWVGDDFLWNPSVSLPAQVEAVYMEMTVGKPHGEILAGE